MSYAVGIDLGTTNSMVSVYRRGVPETLPVEGRAAFPSVVSFRKGGVLVGQAAKARMLINPEQTVASAKRFMGDRSKTYRINRKSLSPVNITSIVLKRLVEGARQALGEDVWDAVITVPAYFTDAQREDTKRAGEEAGLNVLRLTPEPTAAAIAYGIDKGKDQTIMVYDLGGGTFDISVLTIKGNNFEVKAVGGDSRLGGDDFDQAIVIWASKKFQAQTGIDLLRDTSREGMVAHQRLKDVSETAKIELAESDSAMIAVPDCLGHPLELEISLSEYNRLIGPLLDRTVKCIKSVLNDANLLPGDIDRIILVGGSTKNRVVREVVTREIKEPYIADRVDEVVSHGAAIIAANLFLPEEDALPIEITNVTGHSLGVDLLSANKEVVFQPIIPRQSSYPCRRGLFAYTSLPMQQQVDMHVFRGEDTNPKRNVCLGQLSLPVSPPQQNRVPIGAIFELDANGIIHFTAAQLPLGPGIQPIVQYAQEHDSELDLAAVDALIKTGEAQAKTVSVKTQ